MTRFRNEDSLCDAARKNERDLPALRREDAEIDALVRAELSEPDTEDYRLVSDHLAGELSQADLERYEYRIRMDPAFRDLSECLETISRLMDAIMPAEPDEASK